MNKIILPSFKLKRLNFISILVISSFLILSAFAGCSKKSSSEKKSSDSKNSDSSLELNKESGEQTLKEEVESHYETFIFLGDSLTEGYRVSVENNYPTLVEKKLKNDGIYFNFINAGLSGETTAGGLERLKWYMKEKPKYLFLALGSNDGLRGLSLEQTRNNLEKIITDCLDNGVKVFLTGFKLPPNYGEEYTKQFEQIFVDLANKYQLPFLPFLLEGVAGEKELNLEDGIHPNDLGYEIISDKVGLFIKENL